MLAVITIVSTDAARPSTWRRSRGTVRRWRICCSAAKRDGSRVAPDHPSAGVGRNPTRALAIGRLRQIPLLRRSPFNTSATNDRQHRKARVQTQIQADARKTRRWRRGLRAARSNTWRTVYQLHRTICVFCVHLFYICVESFLVLRCHRPRDAAETISNCSQSQHRRSRHRSHNGTIRWRGRGNQPPVGVLPNTRRVPRGFLGLVVQRHQAAPRIEFKDRVQTIDPVAPPGRAAILRNRRAPRRPMRIRPARYRT